MRVLLLNHNVVWSVTFQRAFKVWRGLAGRGHEVTLVTTSRTARRSGIWREEDGVRVFEAPDLWSGVGRTGWDAWNSVQRVRALAGRPFDVIHAFDSRPAVIFPALAVRRRTGAALFMDWADWWGRGGTIQERSGWAVRTFFGPVETWFEEAFRDKAVAGTAISRALEERWQSHGLPAERVLRFPNGCRGSYSIDRAEARARVGISADTPLIAHVGVAAPADLRLLLAAFDMVQERMPEARLAMIGGFRGALPPARLADGSVVRTGFVESDVLRSWLAAADIGVIPLRDTLASRARWPGKINDYFDAGLPAVLPAVGDAAAVVQAHGAGWTSAPEPAAFAGAMCTALADGTGRDRARTAARTLADGPLNWNGIVARLEQFYEEHRHAA